MLSAVAHDTGGNEGGMAMMVTCALDIIPSSCLRIIDSWHIRSVQPWLPLNAQMGRSRSAELHSA